MMLWEILKPVDKKGKEFFDKVVESVKDNPRILWYPSARNDYRDILELSEISKDVLENLGISDNITDGSQILERIRRKYNCGCKRLTIAYDYDIKKEELPNLFIHTDYDKEGVTLKEGTVFDDGRTRVNIKKLCKLKIKKNVDIRYHVDEEYANPEFAYKEPVIYLLDVELESNVLGKMSKPLIYFMFENINFLMEVLLKNRINVYYLVRVKDGCGSLGGANVSMTVIFPFLSILNTKYLITDYHTYFNADEWEREYGSLIMEIAKEYNVDPNQAWCSYTLKKLNQRCIIWSGRRVSVFRVNIKREKFKIKEFVKEIIEPFSREYPQCVLK